jgi:hypothetical protein
MYTAAALVAYALVCVAADPAILGRSSDLKHLLVRAIALASMGGIGAYYWRVQRARRRLAARLGLLAA